MKENTTRNFYEILFDKEDYACFGVNRYKTDLFPAIDKGIKEDCIYFTVNAHKKGTSRSDSNVNKWRNFVFEMDDYLVDGENIPIPLDEQEQIVIESGLPFSTAVWSGKKSYHWIVSLEDLIIEDAAEYEAIWKATYELLNRFAATKNPLYKFDTKTKNPSRFTRAANALRIEEGVKAIQEIKHLRSRIDSGELFAWLEQNGIDWYDYMPNMRDHSGANDYNLSVSDEEKIEFVLKYRMKNQEYVQGNKNNWQFVFARTLKNTGMSEEAVRKAIDNQCPEGEDYRGPIKQAFSSKYNNDEKIYVYSKEEKRAWAKAQAAEEKKRNYEKIEDTHIGSSLEDLFKELEVAEIEGKEPPSLSPGEIVDYTGNPQHYISIADDFYMMSYSKLGKLIKLNKTTLNRNGLNNGQITNLPWFESFTCEPSHDNYRQVVDGLWNTYHPINIQPKEGDITYFMKLINHLYGANEWDIDQTEEIQDWLTILLKYPKQKLHQLYLYSVKQGTSKTAFGKMIKYLVGMNYTSLKASNFEEKYNSDWTSKLLIHIDEAQFSSPVKVNNDLKYYGTEDEVMIRRMNTDPYPQKFYGKFLITTNDIDGVFITEEDRRIWAREVPVLKENITDFMVKLYAEVPAIYYHLLNRKMKYPEPVDASFWLPKEVIMTASKKKMAEINKSNEYQLVSDWLMHYFETSKRKDQIKFVASDLLEKINWGKSQPTIKMIGKVLREELELAYISENTRQWNDIRESKHQGKFFIAERDQFISSDVFDGSKIGTGR